MKKEKVARINGINYCKFPEGICDIESFVELLNKNYNSYIKLEFYEEEECVAPYFIEDNLKTETEYWNAASIRNVKEGEITLLTDWEYEERFDEVFRSKCMRCIHYIDGVCEQNEKSIKEQIDLDGECYAYERKEMK